MTASSRRRYLARTVLAVLVAATAVHLARFPVAAQSPLTAIVGGTLIDGNGGPPVKNVVIVIDGNRIKHVGPRSTTNVPEAASVIDAAGKFITPGFVDTNVHISLYGGGAKDRKETSVRYWQEAAALTLEAAQMHLRFGVTTVRDSYGALIPLKQVRDDIAKGAAVGPRMLVAGNIVGWGGPYSISFALIAERDLSLYEEQFTDFIAQGTGEELSDMYPEELRVAINKYLDKGPDFIKYGGTTHWMFPTFIGFSPEQQKVIVDETHKRGLIAETHATNPKGLRLALEAGIDLIQHPEVLANRDYSDALLAQVRDRKAICSMLTNTITGDAWKKHLKDKEAAKKRLAERDEQARDTGLKRSIARERTSAERRRDEDALGLGMDVRRRNAEQLIKAGCMVTVGTDNYAGSAPEYARAPKPLWQEPGIGTLMGIEGLVELGMTPAQAIVAGTKNGAIASKGLADFGTVEAGKIADILVLDADPLADIKNIRKLGTLLREGKVVDLSTLPTNPIMYRRRETSSSSDR